MSDPRSHAAVLAIDRKIKTALNPIRAWRAEGRSVTAGRAVIRQNGETSDDEETYPILVNAAPTPGFDSVMLPTDGASVHLGVLLQSGNDSLVLGIGQAITDGDSQNNADNSSTSNNDPGSFVNAMQLVTSVPNGTYDVLVDGSFLGGHSAGDSVQFRVSVNGTAGNTRAKSVPSSGTTQLRAARKFSGITVSGGTLTCVIEYRRGDALTGETASASGPAIAMTATRKG